MKKTLLTLLLSLFIIGLQAQVTITVKELADELKTCPSLVLVDAMGADVYAKQHLKGAVNIPHKSLYKDGPIEAQFKSPEELAKIFGDAGISTDSKVVIYDDGSQKYNSRIYWILKHLGVNDVRLLHKDQAALQAARFPLVSAPTKAKAVTFTPNLNNDIRIDMADVSASLGNTNYVLIDSREADEYAGKDKAGKSKGHLPGAVLMNFTEVLTPSGAFKSKDDIIATAAKFGITPDKEVVVYCQTGIKASTVYFALRDIAGFEKVKLYPGAYAEWCSVPENPIEK